MTALATIWGASPAAAACSATASPNTVSCTVNTTTTDTTNTNAATNPSSDSAQTFSTGGSVTGSVASGVTVSGYGLTLQTSEDGAGISFTNNGSVTSQFLGSNAVTLGLITTTGPITYNSAAGASISGSEVSSLALVSQAANATGDITAHVNGTVTNTGSVGSAQGVKLFSNGAVNILLDGTGDITANTAIYAGTPNANSGTSNITVGGSGNITYTSTNGYGIQIEHGANAGTVTVNRSGTITGPGGGIGNNVGISVSSNGTGGTFITGVGAISNVRFGIAVAGTDSFTIAPGAPIQAEVSGISASLQGAGSTSITSAFDITANQGAAISGTSVGMATGSQTVTVTGGTVTGYTSAVSLNGSGSGNLTYNMSGGTLMASTNAGVTGVYLYQPGSGDVKVYQTGGSIGLAAAPIGHAGIIVDTSAGNVDITTTAVYSNYVGVRANAGGSGTVTITNNGTIRSFKDDGVVSTAGTGAITITNHGSILGAGPDAVVGAGSSGAISIINLAGALITNTDASPETHTLISFSNGTNPDIIANAGTLYGRIYLGDGTNTVTNDGTWTTKGSNSFGSGTSTLSNTGTLYAGNGTAFNGGALTFTSTGTFAPTGTVTVTGSLSLGGIYQVGLASGGADKTVVNGAATLTGGIVRAIQLGGGFVVGQSLVIVTASGGVSGTFSSLNLTGSIKAHLAYDANDAFIVIDQAALADSLVNGTINQRDVATGINTALNKGAPAGGFAPIFGLTGPALAGALDNLSGEAATGATTTAFQSMNSFVSLLTNTAHSAVGVQAESGGPIGFAEEPRVSPALASAYAAVSPNSAPRGTTSTLDRRWGVWGASYGSAGRINGESVILGSHDISPRTYGVVAGADYRASAATVFGFAMAGGGTNWGLSNALGSGRSDVFQIGGYAIHKEGPAYLSGALAYAWNGVSTDRTVTLAGSDRLTARYDGQTVAGRIEAGYRFATALAGVTPYAALQAQGFFTPAYGERAASGANTFALSYESRSAATLRTELGSQFDKTVAAGSNATLALRSQLAWVHDTNTERAMNAVFQTLPGSAFTVYGAAAPRDSALLSAGAEMRFVNNVTLGARVTGELAAGTHNVSAQGSLRYAW